jgi:hypothetical protein
MESAGARRANKGLEPRARPYTTGPEPLTGGPCPTDVRVPRPGCPRFKAMPGSGPSFPSHVDTSQTSPSPAGLTCEVLLGESPVQARTHRSIPLPAQGPRALVQWQAVSRGACGPEPAVDGVKAAQCLMQRWTVWTWHNGCFTMLGVSTSVRASALAVRRSLLAPPGHQES